MSRYTIAELIRDLQKHDQDAEIVVNHDLSTTLYSVISGVEDVDLAKDYYINGDTSRPVVVIDNELLDYGLVSLNCMPSAKPTSGADGMSVADRTRAEAARDLLGAMTASGSYEPFRLLCTLLDEAA